MHMTSSNGYKYIVQGRCSISHYPEFRALKAETGSALAAWIYEDLLCRWGTLCEIVTDNGKAFLKALADLEKRYHIKHIRISGYNSRANGLVERPHFDVRQACYKAAGGQENKWSQVVYAVFWSERVTIRRRMGCSPYFAAHGVHPVLPFDIIEATYLLPPPTSILSTEDLIASRAKALCKRQTDLAELSNKITAARRKAALRFEDEHAATIKDFNFKRGDLVLVRHTAVEKSLNRKMRPRYTGPEIVVARNRGGAYILCELNSTVFDRPVAAFRVIPYKARKKITLPAAAIDISAERLRELTNSDSLGDDDPDPDLDLGPKDLENIDSVDDEEQDTE
jgi:hypothetical protein